jgi:pimeloyl-ACP methyl ester carboxylesterase
LSPDPTLPPIRTFTDDAGRDFGYVPIAHDGASGMAVHFSAFFGAWGDARSYRDTFQGYFHRLRMLGTDERRDWLFLCDSYGAFQNGCYYLGEAGDLFVERAMLRIIEGTLEEFGRSASEVVTVGSSMGATGALVTGLTLDVAGIVAICPHIDLDTSAVRQGRMSEVAWACPNQEPLDPANHGLTRRIRRMVEERSASRPLPRLYVQSCEDDDGVHQEQVVPLVELWRSRGGHVD